MMAVMTRRTASTEAKEVNHENMGSATKVAAVISTRAVTTRVIAIGARNGLQKDLNLAAAITTIVIIRLSCQSYHPCLR